jgi:glucose-6-phosphate 1-dehydrogenase
MPASRSDAFVFFGATGDLAYKQIFPALQELVRRDHFEMPVIGVAHSQWSLEQFQVRAKDSIEKHGHLVPAAYAKLCNLMRYQAGDYEDPATFTRLHTVLGDFERPLHYLAIPPKLFATVAQGLANSGCAKDARVIVEKPFGRDLASAQELNRTLRRFFPEQAIFRIDHYLGKESIQNLIYFRFANPLIEAGWNNHHIESVQITMAESFGVAGRGKLYDGLGAIRDVVQNYLLQVIACLAMECPNGRDHEAQRDARGQLFKKMRTLNPADAVRGQYRGYRSESGIAADSQVETFAALRFHIDNERWSGVPFYVRAGKCLSVTATEALVRFKRPPRPILDEIGQPLNCYFRFRFNPEEVLALGTRVKKPGELMVGERIELIAHHQSAEEMQPYERLLGDGANGDATLFAREDSVEEAWRVVDPVLDSAAPPFEYEPNTWGPIQVERAVAPEGG